MNIETFVCNDENVRLDIFLVSHFKISRNQIIELIKKRKVSINGIVASKAGEKLKIGDILDVIIEDTKRQNGDICNVDFEVPIIYEDDDIMIINKPPFLTVHPAPSVREATLVDWLKSKNISLSTISGEERNGIVHRIDKETSGALVIAKNNSAHTALGNQLEKRTLGRYYLALIDYPLKSDIVVEKPIGRNPKNRLKMSISEDGRSAKSAFIKLLINEDSNVELIGAKLYSGRTHQIRVHLSAIGRHILGDDLYGFKSQKAKIKRVMLHAYCVYLTHPISGEQLSFIAPLYDDFNEQLQLFFTKEQINEAISFSSFVGRFSAYC